MTPMFIGGDGTEKVTIYLCDPKDAYYVVRPGMMCKIHNQKYGVRYEVRYNY
ncbi:hypothetical protein HAX54_006667, partial [Datura stramonium]|nr:hypothetical protein [Datura stramonium]